MKRRYTENELWARLEIRGIDIESLLEGLSHKPGDLVAQAEFTRRQDAIMEEPLTLEEQAKALLRDAQDLADALEEAERQYGPGCLPFLQRDFSEGRSYTDNQLREKLAAFYRKHPSGMPTTPDGKWDHVEAAKRRVMNEEYFETEPAFRSWAREEYGEPQLWGLHTVDSPDYWRLVQIDILEAAPWGLKWDK